MADNYRSKDLAFEDEFVDYNAKLSMKKIKRNSSCPSFPKDLINQFSKSDFYVNPILPNRDMILKMHMSQCQAEYTTEKDFKIFIGSWNVNGQSITEDLSPWLGEYPEESARPADIVALGFQELDLRTEAYIFYESHKEAEWLKACDLCLRKIVQRYNKMYGKKWDNLSEAYKNHYISPKKYTAHKEKGLKHSATSLDVNSETNSDEEYKDTSPYSSATRRASFARKMHATIDQGIEALNLENEGPSSGGKAAFYTDPIGINRPVKSSKDRLLHPAMEVKDEEIEEITPFSPYVKLHLVRLVGIMMVIFVKKDILEYITDIASETVGTGLLGKMGNKGGVAIRFNLHGTPLCFVNSHFAAHPEELDRRNQDFLDIITKIQFSQCAYIGIPDHDFVFWFGDLNYRIEVTNQEKAKKHLTNNQISDLMKYDQLTKQKSMGKIFNNFTEGTISFPPTYKYDPGSDTFDTSEKARIPSWCDRILWHAQNPKKVHLVCYRSHPSMRLSDHKPVSALFNLKIQVIDRTKFKKAYEFAMKNIDRLENEYLPQASIDSTEVNFGDVNFMEHRKKNLVLTNVGQVPIQFEFVKKPGYKSYCKSWLVIKPFKHLGSNFIHPGENCKIEISCYVTKSQAPLLSSGADKFEDILVLHLEHGKDFFISVLGNYIRSCFGASLEELVEKGHVPYREASEKPLIDLFDEEMAMHELKAGMNLGRPVSLMTLGNESKRHIQSKRYVAFSLIDLNSHVPIELWIMVAQILERGVKEPELFQKPGLMKEFPVIRNSLDKGTADIKDCNVHSICDALIIFLESLRHPVFPTKLYERIFLSFVLSPNVFRESPNLVDNLTTVPTNTTTHAMADSHNSANLKKAAISPRQYHRHAHPMLHKAHKMVSHAAGGVIGGESKSLSRSRSQSPKRQTAGENMKSPKSLLPHTGEILDEMPLINRDTLKFILSFLQCLLDYASSNNVDYDLLSSIFSRIIIRDEAITSDSDSRGPESPRDKVRASLRDMTIQDQYYLNKKRMTFFTDLLLNSS